MRLKWNWKIKVKHSNKTQIFLTLFHWDGFLTFQERWEIWWSAVHLYCLSINFSCWRGEYAILVYLDAAHTNTFLMYKLIGWRTVVHVFELHFSTRKAKKLFVLEVLFWPREVKSDGMQIDFIHKTCFSETLGAKILSPSKIHEQSGRFSYHSFAPKDSAEFIETQLFCDLKEGWPRFYLTSILEMNTSF